MEGRLQDNPILADARELLRSLGADVDLALGDVISENNQSRRRALIRAVFGEVEGSIAIAKSLLLQRVSQEADLFSRAEIAMLREENFAVDANGAATVAPKFIPLPANFRFTFALVARCGSRPPVDIAAPGWASFRSAVK